MAEKLFGEFLLERGTITPEVLLDALDYQASVEAPFCSLVLEEACLTDEQLAELDRKRDDTDRGLMELAVVDRMLTFDQLEELSTRATTGWMFLGEALVRKRQLGLKQLKELLEAYRRSQANPEEAPLIPLDKAPDKKLASTLVETTMDLFMRHTQQLVEVFLPGTKQDGPGKVVYVFPQNVTKPKSFSYALALPEELALSLASYMLKQEMREITTPVLDAIAEFASTVTSLSCAKLGFQERMLATGRYQMALKDRLMSVLPKDALTVGMKTADGEFQIMVFFRESAGL